MFTIRSSCDEMANRRTDVLSKNMPYLVAEQADLVVGYAYCNWFTPRAAYRFSAEVSIFINKDICGKGVGRQLLNVLMHEGELVGIRKIIAVNLNRYGLRSQVA